VTNEQYGVLGSLYCAVRDFSCVHVVATARGGAPYSRQVCFTPARCARVRGSHASRCRALRAVMRRAEAVMADADARAKVGS